MVGFGELVELLFDVGGRGIGWDGEGLVVVWEGSFKVMGGLVEGSSAGDGHAAREWFIGTLLETPSRENGAGDHADVFGRSIDVLDEHRRVMLLFARVSRGEWLVKLSNGLQMKNLGNEWQTS
jgi:hypothetical protein